MFVLILALSNAACWESPDQGTVYVETIYNEVTRIVRPPGVWTILLRGEDYHPVNIKTRTEAFTIVASTKDNASFTWEVLVTFNIPNNDTIIKAHVNEFGVKEEYRNPQLSGRMFSEIQSQVSSSVSDKDAYKLLEEADNVQKLLKGPLQNFFKQQLYAELKDIVFKGKPDFADNRIEEAASGVVAAKKATEQAIQEKEAAKIINEKKAIEARTYDDPRMFELEKLRIQKDIAKEWANHQGTLVFGSNSPIQLGNK